ncbi:Phosphatidylinositol 4-phosphate 5-kinase 8 [Diplonema papillatum]|nr:Phosphatidylinositol 4-phosphate 5-kinase 8 [Diplonema papillatum]
MCGKGVFTYGVEGDRYEGEFKDDKKHGEGCYTFANGNRYEGEFVEDRRNGFGIYYWVCGDMYSGCWKDGRMEGRGVTVYANGNKYEGDFCQDKREGQGKLTCTDGLVFEGQWGDNMRHGYGVLVFPTGDRYEGDWKEDRKDGRGTDIFVNGNTFTGRYANNVKSGHGVMKYANGDVYDGWWSDDKMHGEGTYRFGNGFVYSGSWKHDCRSGLGEYTFPNNNKYIGEWENDKRHGKGSFHVFKTDELYEGHWVNGRMEGSFTVSQLEASADGMQKCEKYCGTWTGGVVSGKGKMIIGGYAFSGEWDSTTQPKKTDGTIDIPPCVPAAPPGDADQDQKVSAEADDEALHKTVLELSDCKAKLHLLEIDRSSFEEAKSNCAQYACTNSALQAEVADLLAVADTGRKAEKLAKQREQDIKKHLTTIESLSGCLEAKTNRVQQLEKDLAVLRKELAQRKTELADEKKAKDAACADVAKKTEKFATLTAACTAAQHKATSLDNENKKLKEAVKSGEAKAAADDKVENDKFDKLERDAASRKKEMEKLEKELRRLAANTDKTGKENERLRAEIERAEAKLAEKEMQADHTERWDLESQAHAETKKQLQEKEVLLKDGRSQLEAASLELLAAQKKVADLETQANALTRERTSSEQQLSESASESTARLAAAQENLAMAERACESLKNELRRVSEREQVAQQNFCASQEQHAALQRASEKQSSEVETLKSKVASLECEIKKGSRKGEPNEAAPDRVAKLGQRVADYERELDELRAELSKARAQAPPPGPAGEAALEVERLREKVKDQQHELRVEKAEAKNLKDELAGEKKRRKRAEKNAETGLSVEGLRNQLVHLRAEVEAKDRELSDLRLHQEKQNAYGGYPLNGTGVEQLVTLGSADLKRSGRSSVFAGSGTDVAWRLKHLLEQGEEKDRVIENQRQELARVKSLEAKLLTANSRIQGLCQSQQMGRNKDMNMSLSDSDRWHTRSMINEERLRINEEEKREISMINHALSRQQQQRRSIHVLPKASPIEPLPGNGPLAAAAGIEDLSNDYEGTAGPLADLSRTASGTWRPKPPPLKKNHAL